MKAHACARVERRREELGYPQATGWVRLPRGPSGHAVACLAGVNCTGRCLGPEMKFDASHSAGPAGEMSGSRVSSSRSSAWISTRAMCDPRQKWGPPPPKAIWSFGARADVEAVGLGEGALVAVGGAVVHDDLVAGRDRRAGELAVLRRGAAHVDHRAHPAQHLVDRARQHAVEVVLETSALVGMFEQRDQPTAHEVAGGVAAGVDEQQEEEVEVDVVEALAVDLGAEDPARQIVAGVRAFLLGNLPGVVEHLDDRCEPGAFGHGLGGGVDGLGQVVELASVVERDAEQLGDHERGHLAGDVGDGVALAPLDHAVDDLGGELLDAQAQPFAPPRGVNWLLMMRRSRV